MQIAAVIAASLERSRPGAVDSLEAVLAADAHARELARDDHVVDGFAIKHLPVAALVAGDADRIAALLARHPFFDNQPLARIRRVPAPAVTTQPQEP